MNFLEGLIDTVKNLGSEGSKIMREYRGFANSPVYANGIDVIDSTPERQAGEYGQQRYSEFYFPGDTGGIDKYTNPGDTQKAVLEIYNKETLADPNLKKELIVGEMLHGMKYDPKFAAMRDDFANSFTPQAAAHNSKIAQHWGYEGETEAQTMDRTVTDAYIRASFMPSDKNSSEWTNAYSTKQKAIISQMTSYLKTGK